MRRLHILLLFFLVVLIVTGSDQELNSVYKAEMDQTQHKVTLDENKAIQNNNSDSLISTSKDPAIDNNILIDRLDKTADETIDFVYRNNPENIVVNSRYEGSFTDSGKPELLVVFKLSNMPHAGGLDCSVAAIYDRQTLDIISQKTFPADECKFSILKDSKGRGLLLFIGTTTYQGSSSSTLQVYRPGRKWEQLIPEKFSAYTNSNMKFDLHSENIISVLKPEYEKDGSGAGPEWKKKYYVIWDPETCTLKDYIPTTWVYSKEETYFEADSVSPNGNFVIVSHEWGFDESSYVLLYDIKKNMLVKKFDILAQYFGFNWSPDSKKVCISRIARVWTDLTVLDTETYTATDLMSVSEIIDKFKKKGSKFEYIMNESRPDPSVTPIEWSPKSDRILVFYQWTDTEYKRQSGTFVYDIRDKTLSKLVQNPPELEGGNLEAKKPKGFEW